MEILKNEIEAIHFKEDIYIFINHKKTIEYDDTIEDAKENAKLELEAWESKIKNEAFWVNKPDHYNIVPFGGRIQIKGYSNNISNFLVDNIDILKFNMNKGTYQEYFIAPSVIDIVTYLNAIETYGVDTFLDNYKKTITEYKDNLENVLTHKQVSLTEASDKATDKFITKIIIDIKDIIEKLTIIYALLFALNIHLTLEIENEKAISVYNQIEQMYS